MNGSVLKALVFCVISLQGPAHLFANNGGKTGQSILGCGTCHGGQSAATTVTLEGPRTIRAGQTGNYTFVVAHGNANNQYAGFNVSFKQGGGNLGTLTAGTGQQLQQGELTHTTKKAMTGNSARFDFQWTAPAAHGIYNFNGAGNAVNDDGNDTDADDWNVTGNINITVSGATFTGPVGGTSVCRGNSVTFTWTQTGLETVKLEWSKNGFTNTETIASSISGSALTHTYTIPATQDPGDYTVRMVDVATGIEIARVGPVNVVGSPVITLQPASKVVCEGRQLELQVGATGTGLQYRWRQNGVDIPGGTNAVLVINQAGTAQEGTYDCVVFGCGGSTTTSAATITIGRKPTITVQPIARSVCEGADVSFTVDATGSGLVFVWLRNGEPISGEQNRTLSLSKVTQFSEGDYSCLVRGTCTPEVTTNIARLTVVEPPGIRIEPIGRTVTSGDTLTLTFDAKGEDLEYQWFKDGVLVAGATQRVLRFTKIARSDSGNYQCRVRNICDSVRTKDAVVKVLPSAGPGQLELTSQTLSFETLFSCARRDTLMTGLLVNEGAQPIVVTSISADPPALVAVEGLSAPVTLGANERRDVRFVLTPKTTGDFTARVSFFAASGTRVFTITGSAQPGLQFQRDTVVFAEGVAGDRRCNTSIPLPCPATEIRRIRLTGSGASSYRNVTDLTLPAPVAASGTVDLCFETTTADASTDATVLVETDAGDAQFVLTRGILSSVDNEDQPYTSGVRIAPNPMTDELRIVTVGSGRANVRIMSITGETIAQLGGTDEIVWDRRTNTGAYVGAGLYVVLVERGALRVVQKVLVR